MKSTIDIPDALLKEAKMKALEESTTLREIVIRSLQNYLFASGSGTSAMLNESAVTHDSHIRLDTDGFPVLVREADDDTVITNGDINKMREEMGI